MSTSPEPMISRRRALTVIAGVSAGLLGAGSGLAAPIRRFQWRGAALGTEATIILYHPDRRKAEEAIAAAVAEIERLELEFSLYRPGSAICRLNRDGYLDASLDMVRLLSDCRRFSEISDGAFDVTVQPLWRLYADHFAAHPGDTSGPSRAAVAAARARVDYRRVNVHPERIVLGEAMEITLNGIAQGAITDRVAEMLRRRGWSNVLLNLGEIRALDGRGEGMPWSVELEGSTAPNGDGRLSVPLDNRAMATSAGSGSRFEATGRYHHLFDPASGDNPSHYRAVSVIAADATTADALSTAIFTAPPSRAGRMIAEAGRNGEVAAWLTDGDGNTREL